MAVFQFNFNEFDKLPVRDVTICNGPDRPTILNYHQKWSVGVVNIDGISPVKRVLWDYFLYAE